MHVNSLVHETEKHSKVAICEVRDRFFYEFLKNPFLEKLSTDFETRTTRPAEDKDYVF